ncbi:hypothetical protein NY546_13390 [Curtobacterium flaccumfaciens pv. flaccumfaciens]|uniref:hypothetical protein n=1 Tax=Curtobacterium flaccumfaciens TaxID=2035 RepID=UPI00220ABEE0|nr:hypothetical protein [Curtobacterium flaccumfaciens]MCS5510291.1 hypothetical protein [Curtobacterium flaccumfaciens pv. flaccumfaciens]MCX2784954.1 hypothetical protein [Curtobacterium flaccumfaciens pv. flaccumfaciens]UWD84214.1 hypothetical protein NY057_08235 [Curtobacterium flaccumfaciens]
MRCTPSPHRTPSVRRLTVLATCVTLGGALAAGVLVPAQAGAATISHTTHTAHTSAQPAAVAFTAKTYGGPDRKSFTGITFAGTGKPDTLVIVYYDAPGKPRGLFDKHIAEVTSGDDFVSASGHYRFTAAFPDLPRGTTTLHWHARLADPDTLSVIGRVNGTRTLG